MHSCEFALDNKENHRLWSKCLAKILRVKIHYVLPYVSWKLQILHSVESGRECFIMAIHLLHCCIYVADLNSLPEVMEQTGQLVAYNATSYMRNLWSMYCVWHYLSACIIHPTTEPFVVSFEKTIYEVNEGKEQVEVCVILTSPETSILGTVVAVEVYEDSYNKTNVHFPSGAEVAGGSQ